MYVEALPGAKIDGCAMFIDRYPVIGLSGGGKRLDRVLFTIGERRHGGLEVATTQSHEESAVWGLGQPLEGVVAPACAMAEP